MVGSWAWRADESVLNEPSNPCPGLETPLEGKPFRLERAREEKLLTAPKLVKQVVKLWGRGCSDNARQDMQHRDHGLSRAQHPTLGANLRQDRRRIAALPPRRGSGLLLYGALPEADPTNAARYGLLLSGNETPRAPSGQNRVSQLQAEQILHIQYERMRSIFSFDFATSIKAVSES